MDALIVFCAKYLFVFVVVAWLVVWLRLNRETKLRFLAATVIAGIVALILSRIAGKLYFDPRPFVSHHVKPLFSHAADNGFPSDHALFTMMLTAITFFFNKRMSAVMFGLTILVCAGRVLAKVHSPIDIGGGWVFGIIGALAGYYLTVWLFARYGTSNHRKDGLQGS